MIKTFSQRIHGNLVLDYRPTGVDHRIAWLSIMRRLQVGFGIFGEDGAEIAVEKFNIMSKVAKSKKTVKKSQDAPFSCYSSNVDTNI